MPIRFSDIDSDAASPWLWPGYIPIGALTVIDGFPGTGKSTVTCDLAARVSAGQPMPGQDKSIEVASVLILSAEDDAARTIRPRLRAAGADLDRIHAVGRDEVCAIPNQIDRLAAMVRDTQPKLLILDPITSYLSTNANADQPVRKALQPLAELAREAEVAVLLIRHLNKTGGVNPLLRGAGSIGIIGLCRSGLAVIDNPVDPAARVLAPTKNNLGPESPSWDFQFGAATNGAARIEWHRHSRYSAAELLETPGRDRPAVEEAVRFLVPLLFEEMILAREVIRLTTAQGISRSTLKRAKQLLGIESIRKGFGRRSMIYWRLPRTDYVTDLFFTDLAQELSEAPTETGPNGQPDKRSGDHPADDGLIDDDEEFGLPA